MALIGEPLSLQRSVVWFWWALNTLGLIASLILGVVGFGAWAFVGTPVAFALWWFNGASASGGQQSFTRAFWPIAVATVLASAVVDDTWRWAAVLTLGVSLAAGRFMYLSASSFVRAIVRRNNRFIELFAGKGFRLETLKQGADRINEYFLGASRVYILNADPAARLAALAAGKVADTLQRSSMVSTLRMMAVGARNRDPHAAPRRSRVAPKLDALADDLEERDWSPHDIIQAKRELRDANAAYARALDAFDSDVFRRTYPDVFGKPDAERAAASDDEIIVAYSRVLEHRKGMFSDESLLPFSRRQIAAALRRAADDKVYQLGGSAVATATLALDTFVPSDRLLSCQALFDIVIENVVSADETTRNGLLAGAPEIERKAVLALMRYPPPAL